MQGCGESGRDFGGDFSGELGRDLADDLAGDFLHGKLNFGDIVGIV